MPKYSVKTAARPTASQSVLLLHLVVLGLGLGGCAPTAESPERLRARWHSDHGVVYMDQHNYVTALRQFQLAVEVDPTFADGHANLGIAYFSLGKYDSALVALGAALDVNADHLHAHYTRGLIHHAQGRDYDKALDAFGRVVAADPDDPLARYYLGRTLAKLERADEAVAELRLAIDLDPVNVSAYYALAHQLRLQGKLDEWKQALETFSRLSRAGHGSVSPSYQGQGKYAEAHSEGGYVHLFGSALDDAVTLTFAPPVTTPSQLPAGVVAVFVDANGDVLPDLIAGSRLALFANDGGALTASSHWRVAALDFTPTDAVFADVDGDGDVDVIAAGVETHLLLAVDGSFGQPAPIGPGAEHSVLADVDHDGDLDILLIGSQGSRLLSNDGGAAFVDMTTAGLSGETATIHGLFSDFDNDRDIDFLLLGDRGVELYLNNRDGTFTESSQSRGLAGVSAVDLRAGDFRADGFIDLVAIEADGSLILYANQRGRGFAAEPAGSIEGMDVNGIIPADIDNDGDLDLIVYGPGGLQCVQQTQDGLRSGGMLSREPSALVRVEDLDADGALDIWADGRLYRNESNVGRSVDIHLTGLSSNRQGIGAKVEVMASQRRQKRELRLSSRDSRTLSFGIGDADSVDFVRVLWPSGVRQAERDSLRGTHLELTELNRKGTSCPVLYAWDGSAFRFVSDFLGGAIIGYLTAPGEYNTPDTDEYVPLGRIEPLDGAYTLQIANQLEEVSYLDAVHLLAVDHAPGVSVVPNERLLSTPPYPEFQLYGLNETLRPPVAAHDDTGADIRSELSSVDDDWYDGFQTEDIHGYARPYTVTLDLGDLSDIEHPVLVAHGWVDYAHSASNWAAFQRRLTLQPPRLEVGDGRGGWRLVTADMGCPAGLPKSMLFDLGAGADRVFVDGDYRLRITTSAAVYWDQLAVGAALATPLLAHRRRPDLADLHWRGYPAHTAINGTFAFRYHYDDVDPTTDWGTHSGAFTRHGEVTELLASVDDRYVIMAHGDELTVAFSADDFPETPAGLTRSFVFYADGFGKDMDLHSAHSLSVEPLPFHGMSAYPYPPAESYPQTVENVQYRLEYNTRWMRGYYE